MSDKAKTQLLIRLFEPDDLPSLQRIREAAFRPVFESFRAILGSELARIALHGIEAEQAALLDTLCARDSKATVLVAVERGAVAGFVSYSLSGDGQVGEIGLNAVDPAHANKGIGTSLFEFAFERMRERGAKAAAVSTGGDPSHAPARRAYEKAGFGCPIPSVTLYRQL